MSGQSWHEARFQQKLALRLIAREERAKQAARERRQRLRLGAPTANDLATLGVGPRRVGRID